MAPFYGRGSTASRLQPLRGGSLLFTTKFPDIPGTHFIDLGRMKGWVDLGASLPVVLNTGPLDWKFSALTTRPSLHKFLYFIILPSGLYATVFENKPKIFFNSNDRVHRINPFVPNTPLLYPLKRIFIKFYKNVI